MKNQSNLKMGPTEWALLISLAIIWGGSFFFYAIALQALPVFTIVFSRVVLGTLALWLVVVALGIPVPRDMRTWSYFLVMGLLNNLIPFSLIIWGQKEIAPGLAAVFNATTPFFTLLIANTFTNNEKLTWNKLCGAVIGLAGVASMVGHDALRNMGVEIVSQLALICAAISYGFASVFGRRFAHQSPLVTAAGQTTGSSLLLFPLMIFIDKPWTLAMPPISVILAVLGLAFLCTSLAYVMFFTILKRAGATNISLTTFLVPVSAMFLGWLFMSEVIGHKHVIGMIAIGIGLVLVDGRLLSFKKAKT
jgi:drug/metabolite transporter (DMT)-like permease